MYDCSLSQIDCLAHRPDACNREALADVKALLKLTLPACEARMVQVPAAAT
jgi:hypothetical protein